MSNLILPPTDIVVAKNWEGVPNPIRNTSQPYLKFLNTGVFQEDGRRFLRYGYYTNAPYGSKDYNDYWDEQEKRVINGYSVGGVRVTGRHYFYLNFCLIKARPIDPITGAEKEGENRKIITLPRFLDHNFYWFHEFERCAAEGPYTRFPKKGMIVAKSRRKGFSQPDSEIVLIPNGYTTMGTIKSGDYVLTPDNRKVKVLEKFPQGKLDIYELTLFDGRKVRCSLNHLWKIYGRDWGRDKKRTEKIVNTEFLLKENLKPNYAYKWFLKINDPIEYEEKELPIPPYTLGTILGDGNVTKQMKISGIDKDIIENVLVELNHREWKFGGYFSAHLAYDANWQITFYSENQNKYREYYCNKFTPIVNPLFEELKRLKLNVKSKDKFIPEEYKYGSKEQRLALVKGMMDTDGSIVKDGAITFGNVSERLVRDLQNVLYSLGITSTFRQRKDKTFILYINTSDNIFGIKRKQERIIPTRISRGYVAITNIRKLDYQEDCSCISIDSEEKLYLTRDYIPTHNTYQVTGGVYGYNFNFIPASTNILAAYEKGHYKVTLDGIHFTINHINKNTDWGKKQGKLSKRDHFRASFVIKNPHTGIEVEDGYMSEVQAVSFKDNPFKSIGESTDLMGFEECLGKGTKVLMYSKELKNVEDIQVGDQIMGIDSLPKTVIRTISGTDELYKIKQQKGIEYIVNSRHKLHLLQKTSNVNYTKIDGVYNLNISELESLPKYRRRTIYGMKSKGLQYPKKEIFLDPYLVGLWLGDGDKKSLSIVVNKSKDREIQEYLESYSLESGYDLKEYKTNCKHDDVATFTIHRQKHDCIKGRYTQELQNLNVLRNKNIPEDYLYNDENSRLELLAGIIDADGYLCKGTASYSFGYEIVQKNKKLSDDIVTLCRQLGFYTNVKLKKSSSQNGYIGVAYRITIRGDLKRIPVRTERKKLPDDYTPTSDPLNTQIVVEHIGKGEFYGFTLDGTRDVDHLFMLEDLTITHNCGKFEHLLTAYTISEPTFRDGDIMTGVPLMWGCVCKGTKVWTNTGKLVNIEDLKQDDGILGYDGNGISKEPIVWMKPPAKKPCYKIKTTGGNYIECSNDHPLMTSNRNKRNYKKGRGFVYDATFTEAEKIQVGDYLLMTTEVPVFGNNSVSYARELGLMIGDGNYSVNSTPQLSVGEEEIYDYVNSKYNVNIIKHFLQKDNSNFRLIGLKELKPLIRKHGMYGQVKENKRLPEDIDQFDRKSISELIGGYFDADGNVTYNKEKSNLRLVLTSISYELLEQVKYQLIKFGIGSSIYKENRNEGTKISEGQNDHIYRLYISKKDDVIAFRNNITLLSKKKQNLLNQYKIDGKRSMFRLKNVDFKLNPDNNKGTFFINKINMQNLRYEQVTSIEYIGEQEIYNLHTGISNTYLSNGFITKQTGGDMERGTKDFAEMFYDPAPYGLQAYENIYDENATGDCGWFIDDMWYYPGSVVKTYYIDKKEVTEVLPFVDDQGNSHRVIAEQSLDMKREQRRKGSRSAYNKFITQQPKCIDGETIVSYSKGSYKVKDISDKIENGYADLYILKTVNRNSLTCTMNHHIFNGEEYLLLSDYKIGDKIKLYPYSFNTEYQKVKINTDIPILQSELIIDEDLAWFIGLFMGDGHYSGKDMQYTLGISFDKRDVESIEKCRSLMLKYFGRLPYEKVMGAKDGGVVLSYANKDIRHLVKSLGIVYYDKDNERLKRRVHVPDYIKLSPKSVIASFLNGVFDSDGGVYSQKRIGIASKHEEFLSSVSLLLSGFDIYTTNLKTNKINGNGREFCQRSLFLDAPYVDIFAKEIRFTSKRKNDILDKHCIYKSKLRIDRSYDYIESIEFEKNDLVYNLTTDTHYYGANGIWTHNSPAEAFLRVQGTMFDTIRASARLSQIETNKKTFIDSIWKANLVPDIVTGKIKFEYDEEGIPLHEFPIKSNKQKGCIEIYEMPHFDDFGQVPFGRYIAGIDPYDDDQSTTNSVASIFVLDLLTDRIVCHYKGRPETADNSYEIMRKILKFYNAVANYERNKKGLYGYFYNKNCLHLLVDEPEILKDKGISKSNTFGNNSKGSMGSAAVNYYGLQRALQWMSSIAYGEEPESEIINLDKIRSVPLLKEIIAWNPQDNFDDISALGMLMILREDRLNYKDKINKSKTKAVANDQFFDRHINSGYGENGYSNSTILDYIKTESIKKN